ncbi:uncharacterized protein LOC117427214 [Acipenser ruthenus]|uniref:uncharacterized protein LOC117427214 n=1 Tax=Acipenser ruthenus TaxID=7906 RepID=UPI00145BC18B|nr:uncharacterized protein LOC117427214 [Acipenser ruthenus]
MLRSVNKTKQLAPIPMPASGYSVKFLRTESGLNQAMAYIQPLQNNLESTAKREAEECQEVVMEKCKRCEKDIPLQCLSEHIENCGRQPDDTDLEDDVVMEISEETQLSMSSHDNTSHVQNYYNKHHACSGLYRDYVDLVSEDNVFSDSEEEQLNRALEESLKESLHAAVNVEDILQSLRVGINEEEVIRFNLNRRNVWDVAVRAMRRPNFSTNKRVDVKGAVDLGGPMREFFRLVLQHIRNSPMFDGPENQRTLSCHAECKCINQFHFMC